MSAIGELDALDNDILTVSNTALTRYLKSHKVEGDDLATLISDSDLKTKAGYISITERATEVDSE